MQAADFLNRRQFVAVTLVVLVVLSASAIYFWPSRAVTETPAAKPPAVPVPVATVVESEVALWDEFSGRLEAIERVELRSRVAGAVQSVHFIEGTLVNRNDLLVTIDPAPYAAEVDRARAQVVAAQARLSYAKTEYERAQRLWKENFIAKSALDQRVNAQEEADANLCAAEATLQSARLNLEYTQVRAPVAGRAGKLEVTVGNLVPAGPGGPLLTTLVSVDPIYASFDADELVVTRALRDLPAAHGAHARFRDIPVEMTTATADTKPLKGHLQLVDNQVNARSGTVRVRAVFDNRDGGLIPGQFVKLRMGRVKTAPALLIDERAVGTDQSKKFVLVVGPDAKATYREVTLGGTASGLRIVTSGLTAGERIVVSGLQRVRPGSLVAPQPAAMDGGRELPAPPPKAQAPS